MVISLVEDYFEQKPDATRTEVFVEVLIKKVLGGEEISESFMESLNMLYSKPYYVDKIRKSIQEKIMPEQRGSLASIRHWAKRLQNIEKLQIKLILGSNGKFCKKCLQKYIDEDKKTHCLNCQNEELTDIGEFIFITSEVGK